MKMDENRPVLLHRAICCLWKENLLAGADLYGFSGHGVGKTQGYSTKLLVRQIEIC